MRFGSLRSNDGSTLLEALGAVVIAGMIALIGTASMSHQLQERLREDLNQQEALALYGTRQQLQQAVDRRRAHFLEETPWLEIDGTPVAGGTRLTRLRVRTVDWMGRPGILEWSRGPAGWRADERVEGELTADMGRRVDYSGEIHVNLSPGQYHQDEELRSLRVWFPQAGRHVFRQGFAIYLNW